MKIGDVLAILMVALIAVSGCALGDYMANAQRGALAGGDSRQLNVNIDSWLLCQNRVLQHKENANLTRPEVIEAFTRCLDANFEDLAAPRSVEPILPPVRPIKNKRVAE